MAISRTTTTLQNLLTAAKDTVAALGVVDSSSVHHSTLSPDTPPVASTSNEVIIITHDNWERDDGIAVGEDGTSPQIVMTGTLNVTYWFRSNRDVPGMAEHQMTRSDEAAADITTLLDSLDDDSSDGNLLQAGVSPLMETLSFRGGRWVRPDDTWTGFITSWFCRISLTRT